MADHLNSIIQYADQAVQIASGALNQVTGDAGPHPTPDQKKVIVSAERLIRFATPRVSRYPINVPVMTCYVPNIGHIVWYNLLAKTM